ncbi:MAG: hypothetical protein ACTSRZ_01775 [Promethearchaeota archaeon]
MSESNSNISNKEKVAVDKPKKEKKKKIRGFAGIIWNSLSPLNSSEYFKKNYSNFSSNVLLISIDDRHAAYVKVNEGQVEVEAIKYDRKDPKAIKNMIKQLKPDGLLMTDTETFFNIAAGKITTFKLLKMVLARKIRGIKTMMVFSKFFSIAAHEIKNKNKS